MPPKRSYVIYDFPSAMVDWTKAMHLPWSQTGHWTRCGPLQNSILQLAQWLLVESNRRHISGIWTAKYGKQVGTWRNRQVKRNGVPFTVGQGRDIHKILLKSTCPVLAFARPACWWSHIVRKEWSQDSNSDLPGSKAWYICIHIFFTHYTTSLLNVLDRT